MNTGRNSKQTACLCRDTGGKRTLQAQRTNFNTLDNWGHKTPTQSKRKRTGKKRLKGHSPKYIWKIKIIVWVLIKLSPNQKRKDDRKRRKKGKRVIARNTHSAPGYRKNENNWSEIFIIKCSDKKNTDGFQNTMLLVQGTVSSYKRVLLYLVHANKRPLEPKTI